MNTDLLDEVLPQAQRQGLLKPTNYNNPALVSTVNTANQILDLLHSAPDGLTTAQLSYHIKINENTCRCYMRKLVDLGLCRREALSREALWFIK